MGTVALGIALALPACVLSERLSAAGHDATTGDDEAMPAGATSDDTPASGSTSDGDGSDGPTSGGTTSGLRDEAATTEGDDEGTVETGRPEDLPDPGSTGTAGASVFGDDCCAPTEGIGCGDPDVEACVCDLDPYCCESAWDDVCVDLMEDAGCLSCDAGTQLVPDNCCVASDGPGCPETAVADCVCAVDPFCCDVLWDGMCVALVDEHACGTCLPPACCEPSVTPGCAADPEIETCVCAADPFCCEQQWDNLCVSEVQTVGCGDCAWVSEGGGCCVANGTPGCDDPDIEACVCPGDPFCCQTSWDSLCVDEVDAYGCGTCPEEPMSGESGGTDGGGSSGSDSGARATYGSSDTG